MVDSTERIPLERRTDLSAHDLHFYRQTVQVVGVEGLGDDARAYVLIPGWKPDQRVVLPLSWIPDGFRPHINQGYSFVAHVNTGAEKPEDVYFKYYRACPPDASKG